MNISQLSTAFKDSLSSRGLSQNTLLAYCQDLREIERFFGAERLVAQITGTDCIALVTWLRSSRQLAPATVKRRLSPLKSMMKWAERRGIVVRSPLHDLDLPAVRLTKQLPRCLHRQEARRVLNARAHDPIYGIAIALMIATGIRVGELVAIKVEDVDVVTGRIRIMGKGSRERTVFVADATLKRRLAALSVGGSSDHLFSVNGSAITTRQMRRALASVAKRAGVSRKVTPHMLRHTAATALLEAGTDIRIVQKLLGHASIVTTQIYAHVSDVLLEAAVARADVLSVLAHDGVHN